MARPPTTWKGVEKRIARYLGGERRGAEFSERTSKTVGKTDVVGVPGWAIEIKHGKDVAYGDAVAALHQAEKTYDVLVRGFTPVAIIHKADLLVIEQSVVCFLPDTWDGFPRRARNAFCVSTYFSKKPMWKNIVGFLQAAQTPAVLSVGRDVAGFRAILLPMFLEHILPIKHKSKN